jgi:hypothetical protein
MKLLSLEDEERDSFGDLIRGSRSAQGMATDLAP